MKFALDTEFIDTPTCSTLISLALVAEDDRALYLEFPYEDKDLTPWLREHVVPHLSGEAYWHTRKMGAQRIREFLGGSAYQRPQIWAYFASHDWYWFCRVFGGMMEMPDFYPHRPKEFADVQYGVPDIFGPPHHALNDARSLMAAMKDYDASMKAKQDYNDRARDWFG